MSNTRQFFPVFTLIGIIVVSALLALNLTHENQLPLFLFFFLSGMLLWVFLTGGGWRVAEKDSVVIIEDFMRKASEVRYGTYLYVPIAHSIEAKMPSYPLIHEFEVESIDTQTPKIQQIKKIKVRVRYEIVSFLTCYERSADVKERIKALEASAKLKRDDPALWTRVLNGVMHGIIDDAIRDGVWRWAEAIMSDPNLKLDMPSLSAPPKFEHDPYALSLNRVKLADKVQEEVRFRAQRWGLKIHRIVFENIDLDPEIIRISSRNKPGELEEARHLALKDAVAIREKGMAEAEVRAVTVAKIIEVLMNQERIPLTEQVLYNIVRAAMYSDGQMIMTAAMEKSPSASVKAA